MPIYIDPEWEYYCPSEEILEAEEDSNNTVDQDLTLDEVFKRAKTSGYNSGYRRGNPNGGTFKMSRVRHTSIREKKNKLTRLICNYCEKIFQANNRNRLYCSLTCSNKDKEQFKPIPCSYCNSMFKPYTRESLYCSRKCANKISSKRMPDDKVKAIERLHKEGKTCRQIAKELGIGHASVARWRKTLGLYQENKVTEEVKNKLYELYSKGASFKEIRDQCHISIKTIFKLKKKLKINRREGNVTIKRGKLLLKFKEMYEAGHTYSQITEELKIVKSTIRQWAKLLNLPPRHPRGIK